MDLNKAPSKNPRTITRWILTEQRKHPTAKGDLSILLNSITLAVKIISGCAQGAGVFHQLDRQLEKQEKQAVVNSYDKTIINTNNAGGDEEKSTMSKNREIDTYAQEVLINSVSWSGKVSMIVTQQSKQVIRIPNCESKYVLLFDPLDGSQNIKANVSVGSIFGIVRVQDSHEEKDILQPGNKLVCAGYALYGDATLIVMTFGNEVNGFTLDPTIGEFVMTHKNIRIPERGHIYSVNEGNREQWDPQVTDYVDRCKKTTEERKAMKLRYIGSMVADVHRTLLYGGIFLYPATKSRPNGKLFLMYEVNPLAFIVKTAGGRATNGHEPILDIMPTDVHQNSPIFMGSALNVMELEQIYNEAK